MFLASTCTCAVYGKRRPVQSAHVQALAKNMAAQKFKNTLRSINLKLHYCIVLILWSRYTARNAQVAASLLSPSRYEDAFASLAGLDDNKLQVCHKLLTDLLQLFLQISSCSKFDVHRLDADLMKSAGLIKLVGKLHRAGKIHNLHQVCGVWLCSTRLPAIVKVHLRKTG